jgi:hypothetical protein
MESTEKEKQIAIAFADWIGNKGIRKTNFVDANNNILGARWIETWKKPEQQGDGWELIQLYNEFIANYNG